MASVTRSLLLAACRSAALGSSGSQALQALPAARLLGSLLGASAPVAGPSSHNNLLAGLHTSAAAQQASAPETVSSKAPTGYEPARKYRSLADKELWHEAWMYEDRFGTEDSPIIVPSLEAERIIGVTDPEDDNLVVWGILREGEGPRQFIEGGEFYLLKKVPYVQKVGDVLEALEGGASKTSISK